jgi:aminoglycoside phosphotransferase (APT) family kinase protein/GNAT superfamily N-acetyltransferase
VSGDGGRTSATGSHGTPRADVETGPALVAALVRDQHPDLADLPLRGVGHGWDNATYRLGEELAVRLPRRALAAPLVEHEQRWLPELAPGLPLPIPVPLRTGTPGRDYPYRWSIVPWFDGQPGDVAPLAAMEAATLGRFLAALHHDAPSDAPSNPFRGGPFEERVHVAHGRLDDLAGIEAAGDDLDLEALREVLDEAAAAPGADVRVWLHGDLHPRNLLVRDGRLTAVLDWGDLCAGDPATDLAIAWLLLDAHGRASLRAAYGGTDEATWTRARGWAVHLGAMLAVHGGRDDAAFAATGRRALLAVLHDARPRRAERPPDGGTRQRTIRVDDRLGLALERTGLSGRTLVTYARDHVTVRTPSRPDFRAGNSLDLLAPPSPDALPGWIDRFDATIGMLGVRHVQLRWEEPLPSDAPAEQPRLDPGLDDALRAAGFDVSAVTMLLLDELRPAPVADADLVPVAPPSAIPGGAVDRRWHAATVLYRYETGTTPDEWRAWDEDFVAWSVEVQRELALDERAQVWLAVRHGGPVGRLTVLHDRQRLAVVEDVIVHPAHRRRGIASALTHRAVSTHLAAVPGSRVGVGAEPGSSAERLYRRLGFRPHAAVWTARRG